MHALRRCAAVAALLCLAACSFSDDEPEATPAPAPAPQAKPSGPTISNADAENLRAQIYPHWLVPTEPQCHQQLRILIVIAQDGNVTSAEAKPELPYDDPCRPAQDSALRAIWAASPLRVPRTRKWDRVNMVFDLNAVQQP